MEKRLQSSAEKDKFPYEQLNDPEEEKAQVRANPATPHALNLPEPVGAQQLSNDKDIGKIPNEPNHLEKAALMLIANGFTYKRAWNLVLLFNVETLEGAYRIITTNEFGRYPHPFIEDELDPSICTICESADRAQHDQQAPLMPDAFDSQPRLVPLDDLSEVPVRSHSVRSVGEHHNGDTCEICFDALPRKLTIRETEHDICEACFRIYLETEIKSRRIARIVCPHCDMELRLEDISNFVSAEILEKYHKFQIDIQIAKDPLARHCCDEHCRGIIRLRTLKDEDGTCPICMAMICLKCNLKYHGKTPCSVV